MLINNRKKEKITYGIVGLGRFGESLALALAESGADLVVIDRDEEKVRKMNPHLTVTHKSRSPSRSPIQRIPYNYCVMSSYPGTTTK